MTRLEIAIEALDAADAGISLHVIDGDGNDCTLNRYQLPGESVKVVGEREYEVEFPYDLASVWNRATTRDWLEAARSIEAY